MTFPDNGCLSTKGSWVKKRKLTTALIMLEIVFTKGAVHILALYVNCPAHPSQISLYIGISNHSIYLLFCFRMGEILFYSTFLHSAYHLQMGMIALLGRLFENTVSVLDKNNLHRFSFGRFNSCDYLFTLDL